MHVLTSFDDHEPVPWANGVGKTTEIISLTESERLTPGLRPWRLSIARLNGTGPFSALPGMARTFLPTAEVALDIDGQTVRVSPAEPISFLGGQDVRLVELAQPCFAINLMVDNRDASGRAAGDGGTTAGERGGSGHRRGCLTMSLGDACPARGSHFVLTLQASSDRPRFQLLALDAGDDPRALGEVVVLSDTDAPA